MGDKRDVPMSTLRAFVRDVLGFDPDDVIEVHMTGEAVHVTHAAHDARGHVFTASKSAAKDVTALYVNQGT